MKFLHLADLHIGKQVNGFSMVDDQRFVLERVIRMMAEQEVDALVLAGDLYDKSSPSAEAVSLFDWFLSEVADAGVPCFAIPGNHDSSERIAFAQDILRKQQVYFPPVYEGQVAHFELEDQHGPVVFWLLPFLKPGNVRRFFPDAEIGNDYTAAIREVLGSCEVDPAKRNVLVAHQFVTYSGKAPELSDSEISLGGVDNVDASVFNAFDYVALGHVHRPQRIGRDEVRYAGSLLKYSFSEAKYAKSAVLVELGVKADAGDNCVSFELLPLPCLHDMREIRGPLEELIAPETAQQGNADDYLHVTLTDEHAHIDAMARVRAVYPNVMVLDYDNSRKSWAGSAADSEPVDPDALDPFELFEAFFQEQVGHELDETQRPVMQKAMQHAIEGSENTSSETQAKGGAR